MSELRDLYQQVILDHYRTPRNFSELAQSNRRAEGYNPLCGDRVQVYAQVEGDTVQDISFQGAGCAISTASASLMTEAIKGRPISEALQLTAQFRGLMTGNEGEDCSDDLGKLQALGGVREYPTRIKCATLAWHALEAALLEAAEQEISTE